MISNTLDAVLGYFSLGWLPIPVPTAQKRKGEVSATFAACLAYKRNKQETRELIRQINETGNGMLKALGMVIKSWSN